MADCKNIIFTTLLLSITLLFSGCGGSGKTTNPDPDINSDTVISLVNQDQLIVSLDEKSKQYTYSFTLHIAPLDTDITLDYHTKNGSAVAGSDYIEKKGTLSLTKGTTIIKVDLEIMSDNVLEEDETFSLIFNNSKGIKFSNNVTELIAIITLKNYAVVKQDDVIISVVNQQALTVSLVEKDNPYTYSFSLQIAPLAGDITLDYHTKNGSATAGNDYVESKGTLQLTKGDTTINVDLEVNGDTIPEEDEVFSLVFDHPTGAKFANNVNELTATITLKNDDAIISVVNQQQLNVSLVENNNKYTHVFSLQIAPLETDITLDYYTKNSSAIAGSDYVDKKGTLILAKGSTTISVALEVRGDTIPEEDEVFSLIFDNPTGAKFANNADELVAIITLKNDDPILSVIDQQELSVSLVEKNNQYTHVFSLQIAPLKTDITLDYYTKNGSATAGKDFFNIKGRLTLPKGSTAIKVSLEILGDIIPEEDETFSLIFDNIKAVKLKNSANQLTATITIKNDDVTLPPTTISLLDENELKRNIFERSHQHVYTYTLSIAPLTTAMTLDYSTESGTATAGNDFIHTNGTLKLNKGATKIEINVLIMPDNLPEEDETFSLILDNPKGGEFANNESELRVTLKIKDSYDTPVATKALSGILISSIPPILAAEALSTQPDAFANALLVGTNDTATITCPDSGTFSYVFTDINADDQYKDIGDIFAITVDKCVDATQTSDGRYSLTIKATSRTATEISKETALLFEGLSFKDKQKSSTFTGLLNLTSTEPLNGIDPLLVEITSTQIKLKNTDTYHFSTLISSLATDAITNEKTITKYDAQVLLSNNQYGGQYKISLLEPLKRSVIDDYPYQGKIKIERIDAVMNIMLTVLNSQQVKLETDTTGDGKTNHEQNVLWTDLSDPF